MEIKVRQFFIYFIKVISKSAAGIKKTRFKFKFMKNIKGTVSPIKAEFEVEATNVLLTQLLCSVKCLFK